MLTIEVSNRQKLELDEQRLISAVRLIADDQEIAAGEISIAVVDGVEMQRLNNLYLGHDYETDVLSFVLEYDKAANKLDGQLIVSAYTAVREAGQLEIDWFDELLFYVVHGTLHLVGFEDKDPAAAAEMRDAEADYLNRMDIEHVWPDSNGDDRASDNDAEAMG